MLETHPRQRNTRLASNRLHALPLGIVTPPPSETRLCYRLLSLRARPTVSNPCRYPFRVSRASSAEQGPNETETRQVLQLKYDSLIVGNTKTKSRPKSAPGLPTSDGAALMMRSDWCPLAPTLRRRPAPALGFALICNAAIPHRNHAVVHVDRRVMQLDTRCNLGKSISKAYLA